MAHGVVKNGGGSLIINANGTKNGVSSRRIFSPHFKLQVLDSYRNDNDCKGNQRATARKYGIHRRQIQKWLQVEGILRKSITTPTINSSASAVPPEPETPIDLSCKRTHSADTNAWDLSLPTNTRRKEENLPPQPLPPPPPPPATQPPKLFKPYLDTDDGNQQKNSTKAASFSPIVINNPVYPFAYVNNNFIVDQNKNFKLDCDNMTVLKPFTELLSNTYSYYYPLNTESFSQKSSSLNDDNLIVHQRQCENYDDYTYHIHQPTPLKKRHSYTLDFKVKTIESYYSHSVPTDNAQITSGQYNMCTRHMVKRLKESTDLKKTVSL